MSQVKGLHIDENSGLLCCRYTIGRREHVQVIFPDDHASEVLALVHDQLGHFGIKRMLRCLKQMFYWPEMSQRVQEWVSTCDQCMKNKKTSNKARAPLQLMPEPVRPFEWVSMDIAGPFPTTSSSNRIYTDSFPLFQSEIINDNA